MADFIKGSSITSTIEDMFSEADEWILICSPYIKLHSHIKATLKKLQNKPACQLTIVFGKNENDLTKSLNEEDFEFLKELPNVQIKHEPRLHAKYYASEKKALLSSMNLYDFSHNNNIEFGILTKYNGLKRLGKTLGANEDLDYTAEEFFKEVEREATTVFKREPEFKKSLAGFRKTYENSTTVQDELTKLFTANSKPKEQFVKKTPESYSKRNESVEATGYCIRTGAEIPFNLERPMSRGAFQIWNQFQDENYAENYCHFSGEESHGETSYARPVLRKNWKKASSLQRKLHKQKS